MSLSPFPVLRSYRGVNLSRIALPLGGIGTGTIALNGRGGLQDFECVNRPAKGFTPEHTFFAIHVAGHGTRLLEGPLPDRLIEGATGSDAPQHNLPRFAEASFDAAYPFATVRLADPAIPLTVRLEAYNPLTPPDVESSAWPVASLRWVLRNPTRKPIKASIAASLKNFIGADGSSPKPVWGGYPSHAHHFKRNRNSFITTPRISGIRLHSEGLDPNAETWGTLALAAVHTKAARAAQITHRTSWAELSWGDKLLDFWDDLSADGKLDDRAIGNEQGPIASVCVSVTVPPGGEVAVPFVLAWHFPNRPTWSPKGTADDRVGNHYATRFADAFDAAERFAADADELETRTRTFVDAVLSADVPEVVKEACLFNLPALRSQTSFMTDDGKFYGWEGCHPHEGSCWGSCTHVWNYEAALPQLFGPIARDQRRTEFAHATDERGLMSFRVNLPLSRAATQGIAAADGQMGCIVRLYREWRASGELALLRDLYPHMKRALAFAWIPGGWDADRDGLMEGCQHNTMDVEYYGPNPQMQAWYLAALLAASEMAEAMNDLPFARTCSKLFVAGSNQTDEQLFNGDYYEHKIIPPGRKAIAKGLTAGMGSKDLRDPDLQLGAGCLVDQLAGQFVAHQAGLGHVLHEDNVRAALLAVHRHNFRRSLHDHFNHMRTYAQGDEPGTIMASFPLGRRPRRPFPYYNECMTGFEYTAAVGLLQEGCTDEGLELIAAVRARHTGDRRNPFDEPECGHHYARTLAVWAALPALQGTDYDGRTGHLTAIPPGKSDYPRTLFIATGDAYATLVLEKTGARFVLHEGILDLQYLTLPTGHYTVGRTLVAPYELVLSYREPKPAKAPQRKAKPAPRRKARAKA